MHPNNSGPIQRAINEHTILHMDSERNVEMLVTLRDTADQTLLHPLVYAHVRVDGDGFDLLFYHEEAADGEEPLARVLIEYHKGEVRVLLYPAGTSIEDDPSKIYRLIGSAELAPTKEGIHGSQGQENAARVEESPGGTTGR